MEWRTLNPAAPACMRCRSQWAVPHYRTSIRWTRSAPTPVSSSRWFRFAPSNPPRMFGSTVRHLVQTLPLAPRLSPSTPDHLTGMPPVVRQFE